MYAAISEATWAFLGVLVTNAVILAGLFIRQGKQARSVEQINRAVNHQPEGSATLVERVGTLEDLTDTIVDETRIHRSWEWNALGALAHHVGCVLPVEPEEGV